MKKETKKNDKKEVKKVTKKEEKKDVKKEVKAEVKKGAKKVKNLMNDFSTFAMKGNVIDLAVGVVIGGAFGKIVTSLVNDLVMPAISVLTGEINLATLSYTLVEGVEATEETEAVAPIVLTYGNFLQTIVEFLIIAFSIFIALRYLDKIHKKIDELKKKEKEEEKKVEEAKKETTDEILIEIRDLLKKEKEAK